MAAAAAINSSLAAAGAVIAISGTVAITTTKATAPAPAVATFASDHTVTLAHALTSAPTVTPCDQADAMVKLDGEAHYFAKAGIVTQSRSAVTTGQTIRAEEMEAWNNTSGRSRLAASFFSLVTGTRDRKKPAIPAMTIARNCQSEA